jgi:hypothetical protein
VASDAVHNRAAIVHRVLKDRTGIDNPIEMGDGQANLSAVNGPQVARPSGAVQINRVIDTPIAGGQYDRRTVPDQSQMADQTSVEYGVQVGAVSTTPFAMAGQRAARGARQAHAVQHAGAGRQQ